MRLEALSACARAEFRKHFLGVLAKPRSSRTRPGRGAVEVRGRRDHRYRPGFSIVTGIRDEDDAAGSIELFVGQDLFHRLDRGPEHIRFG